LDRTVGISTLSGSSAVRGLRGVSGALFEALPEEAPAPFTDSGG
jgi:hypothetical protein